MQGEQMQEFSVVHVAMNGNLVVLSWMHCARSDSHAMPNKIVAWCWNIYHCKRSSGQHNQARI
jgi:hypothetical protein